MKRISIRINILTHFIFLILFSALLLLSIQYYFSTRSAMEASEQNFHSMFERVQYRIFSLNQQNRTILELLQQHPYLQETPVPTDKLLPIFCESLSQFPEAYAVYLATGEDNFFEVVNMGHSSLLERQLHAPSETAWTVIKVYPGKEENNYHFQYYNTNHDLLGETFKTTDYKASERPWFRNALKTSEIYQSKPYMFWHLKAPGVTLSKQINSDSVLAIDYTIEHLAQLFERLKPTQDSQVVLFNALGEKYFETDVRPEFIKLAMNGFALNKTEKEYIQSLPLLKVSNQSDWEPFDFVRNGNAGGFSVALIKSLVQQIGFNIQFVNGYTWDEILEEFQQGRIDILHSLLHTPERESMGIFTRPYYPIDNYIITRAETKQVTELAQLKQLRFALGKGWQSTNLLLDNFPDLDYKLYDGLPAMMRAVSSGEVDALIDNADTFARNKLKFQIEDIKLNQKLERFITRGNNLYFLLQDKYAPLVTILNRALDSIDPKSLRELEKKWYLGTNLKHRVISPYEDLFFRLMHNLPAQGETGLFKTNLDGSTYLTAVSPIEYGNEQAYLANFVPLSAIMAPYRKELYVSFAAIALCLGLILWLANLSSNMIVRPINELMLRNHLIANRRFNEVTHVETHIKELSELSKTLLQVSDSFQRYEKNQESFLHGLVELLAKGIDKRSHHTFSHCSRVPKLGIMILRAAINDEKGIFKNFKMSEEQQQAFKLGAWLHDSGKITTPESLLGKSTKLDTFYNRIHEIRMRFEVLWRDAEIDFLNEFAQTSDPEQRRRLKNKMDAIHHSLQEDFTFIAALNIGNQDVNAKALERLDQIARKTWLRHFDKYAGLSKLQLEPVAQSPNPGTTEYLLQDKPEHIIKRERKEFDYYREHGLKMHVPEHERNLGEKYNLSVARGTLTPEERFKIEEHVVMTIKLLERVPLPEHYRSITKYAGTHHEKLNGTGYPRGLKKDQLGIPERIMALADIFEALTAPDRPYKRTHTLSTAFDILYNMVEENEVDKDVFELFLRSGVYMQFAQEYIDPKQIDTVDINKYLDKKGTDDKNP